MTTPASIATTVPAAAVAPALYPWRGRVHLTSDGYRLLLYSNGTGLVVKVSKDGQSGNWGSATTVVASGFSSGMTPLVTSCLTYSPNNPYGTEALFVFVGQPNGTVDAYKVPYTSGGTLGTVQSQTSFIAGLTTVPQSIACVFDPAGATTDAQTGSELGGIIHLLIDSGSRWDIQALDPTSTAGTLHLKSVLSSYVLPSITGPTYATNLLVRKANTLYAISPGATRWYAYELTYASGVTTSTGTVTGPNSINDGASYQLFNSASPPTVGANLPTEHLSLAAGTIGGFSYPTGTWTLSLSETRTGVGTATVFYTITATIKAGNSTVGALLLTNAKGDTTVSGPDVLSGTIAGFTVPAGQALTVSIAYQVSSVSGSGQTILTQTNGALITPTPTKQSTGSTTINQYTWGTQEQPTLPLSQYGASMVPTTATDPAVDLFTLRTDITPNQICTQQRYAGGGYSTVFNLGGTSLLNGGTTAIYDPKTGDEAVFYLATISTVLHVACLRRTNGTWGGQLQDDSDVTNVQSFCAIARTALSTAGQSVASVDTGSPVTAWYDDSGFVAGASGASQPDQLTLIDDGTRTTFGTVAPFVITGPTPTYQFRYNVVSGGTSNKLGALQVVVKEQGTNTLQWDSGKVGVTNGPAPGGLYSVKHGSIGNAISLALASGHFYYVQVYAWDVTTGTQSPISAVVNFTFYGAPVVTYDGPSTLTTFQTAFTFDFFQQGQKTGVAYDLSFTDSTGKTVLDLGVLQIGPLQPSIVESSGTGGVNGTGQNKLTTLNQYPTGTALWLTLASSGVRERVITTGTAVADSTNWQHTLTTNLVNTHVANDPVAIETTTPALTVWPGLPNDETLTAHLQVFAQPPTGSAQFSGSSTASVSTTFPEPATPHDLIAIPVPGVTPLSGGYIALRFVQDPGSSSLIVNPATWNVYQRETGTTAWELVTNLAAFIGTGEIHCCSVKNGIAYDFAVSAVSADGVETALATVSNTTLYFRVGVWMNNLANPKECVELGITDASSSSYLTWQSHDDAQYLVPFNRQKPVTLFGTESWVDTAQTQQYRLEPPYDYACRQQLITWQQNKTPLQVRDASGEMLLTVLRNLQRGSIYNPNYLGVSVDFTESDAGSYALLAVLP